MGLNTSYRGRLDQHQGHQPSRRSIRPRCSVQALPASTPIRNQSSRGGTGPAPTGVSGRTSGNATRGAPAVPTYGYPATRPVSRRSWTTERCSRTRRCAKRRISASGPLLRVTVVESVVVVERSARNAPHRGTKRSHIHRYPDLRGARVPPWGRLEGRVMGRGAGRVRGAGGGRRPLARERECLAQEGR